MGLTGGPYPKQATMGAAGPSVGLGRVVLVCMKVSCMVVGIPGSLKMNLTTLAGSVVRWSWQLVLKSGKFSVLKLPLENSSC